MNREFVAGILEADVSPPEATFDNVVEMMSYLDDTSREKDGRYFLGALIANAVFWFGAVLPWMLFAPGGALR